VSVGLDEAAVMARVKDLLETAPGLPDTVTIAKVLYAYGVAAHAQGAPLEEIDRNARLIRWAWEVASTPVRQLGPCRLRLVLDEPEPEKPRVIVPRFGDAELVARYVLALRRRNLAPTSIKAIEGRLRTFARAHRGSFATATRGSVEALLDKRGLSPRSRYWWLSCLHGFYAWAIDEELLDVDPTAKISRPKLTKNLPRPMPEADVARALAGAEPMMRCWLLLGAFGGLRCQEIAGLSVADVDVEHGVLRVVFGKGRKERAVPLHPEVLESLQALPMPASGFVFRRAQRRDRYPAAQLVQELNAYLRSLGIKSTAHSLRHAFATAFYNETHDLRLTQELMGHESPSTTAIYTAPDWTVAGPAVAALRVRSE
jgi:site-specific recombinase XerD